MVLTFVESVVVTTSLSVISLLDKVVVSFSSSVVPISSSSFFDDFSFDVKVDVATSDSDVNDSVDDSSVVMAEKVDVVRSESAPASVVTKLLKVVESPSSYFRKTGSVDSSIGPTNGSNESVGNGMEVVNGLIFKSFNRLTVVVSTASSASIVSDFSVVVSSSSKSLTSFKNDSKLPDGDDRLTIFFTASSCSFATEKYLTFS